MEDSELVHEPMYSECVHRPPDREYCNEVNEPRRSVNHMMYSLLVAYYHDFSYSNRFTSIKYQSTVFAEINPGRLIFRTKKQISKTHQNPSVLCTPPFEKSPIKSHRFYVLPPFEKSPIKSHRFYVLPPLKKSPIKIHRFCVLPPLKNHPSKPIGFVYSPLWKITHQKPSVLCTSPFEKWLFLVSAYFGVAVYFGKYGPWFELVHRNSRKMLNQDLLKTISDIQRRLK